MPAKLLSSYSTRPYPATSGNPGVNPFYILVGVDPATNTTVRDMWQLNNKYYEEDMNVNRVLVDRFLYLLPEAYRNVFNSTEMTINPKMTFLKVLNYIWDQYGTAMEEDIIENTADLPTL